MSYLRTPTSQIISDGQSIFILSNCVGNWGGGKDHNDSVKGGKGLTKTCKLPKTMLPVVVGEDGKVVTDIARYCINVFQSSGISYCPP